MMATVVEADTAAATLVIKVILKVITTTVTDHSENAYCVGSVSAVIDLTVAATKALVSLAMTVAVVPDTWIHDQGWRWTTGEDLCTKFRTDPL